MDPRLRNGPIGFCASEDDRIIGHVGVADLTARTLNGSFLEKRAKGAVYDKTVLDSDLLDVCRSRSHVIQDRSYGLIMLKLLAAGASFMQTYGDRFYSSRLNAV